MDNYEDEVRSIEFLEKILRITKNLMEGNDQHKEIVSNAGLLDKILILFENIDIDSDQLVKVLQYICFLVSNLSDHYFSIFLQNKNFIEKLIKMTLKQSLDFSLITMIIDVLKTKSLKNIEIFFEIFINYRIFEGKLDGDYKFEWFLDLIKQIVDESEKLYKDNRKDNIIVINLKKLGF